MFKRNKTHKVLVGKVQIGGNNKIIIQSMTNTKTSDIKKTLNQIKDLHDNGAQLVRVSILDNDDVNALKDIIFHSPIPIIADIHYNYLFAIKCIELGVQKVRINPANITNETELNEIIIYAKKYNTAIRFGFNKGSYKNITNNQLIKECLKIINQAQKNNFKKIILSIKSSSTEDTIYLNKLLANKTKYPIHLGVSEAGIHDDAIIKSTIALTPLLKLGIGNTIRISISGSPLNEPIIAKKILGHLNLYPKFVNLITCPTCGRIQWDIIDFINKALPFINKIDKKMNIAIMGCAVNGIGECVKADFGIYCDKKNAYIYKNHRLYKKTKKLEMEHNIIKLLLNKYE